MVEEVAADLRKFGEQCKEILKSKDLQRSDKRRIWNCATYCGPYADKLLDSGLNATTKTYWRTCHQYVTSVE